MISNQELCDRYLAGATLESLREPVLPLWKIREILAFHGVKIRDKRRPPQKTTVPGETTAERRERFKRLYNDGMTLQEISDANGGLSTSRIWRILKDAGVTMRSGGYRKKKSA